MKMGMDIKHAALAMCIAGILMSGLAEGQPADVNDATRANAAPPAIQSLPGVRDIFVPPADVLFNNGPVADGTESSCSGDIGNQSVVEHALGTTNLGSNVSLTATADYRIADDFTVPPGPAWTVSNAYLFAYQTGSGNTSTITGVTARIWNGSPADAASMVICGDAITNVMTGTAFSGIFRMVDNDIDCTRPIMVETVDLSACPALPSGTYWVDWQMTGSEALSGPWNPPLAVLGQTTTGDAVQGLGGVWGPILDAGSMTALGMPFLIAGASARSLSVDSAAATLTDQCATAPSQNNSVVEPGETVQISVPIHATGGAYTGVTASLGLPAPTGVSYLTSTATLGDIDADGTATAAFEIKVDASFMCLSAFSLPIAVTSTEGDAAGTIDVDVGTDEACTVCVDVADLIFRDDFEGPPAHRMRD